jgi:hypothetical protein
MVRWSALGLKRAYVVTARPLASSPSQPSSDSAKRKHRVGRTGAGNGITAVSWRRVDVKWRCGDSPPACREAEDDLDRIGVGVRREQVGDHKVAQAGCPAGVQYDGATSACGLGAQAPGGGRRAHGDVEKRAALAQHHTLGGELGMGHGINDEVSAGGCRCHGFRAIEVHDVGARDAITSPHGAHDAPAGVLERAHESTAQDSA